MACLVGFGLPRYWHRLPGDHGKGMAPGGEKSKGKPTGESKVENHAQGVHVGTTVDQV
jgi:hypothetical protein